LAAILPSPCNPLAPALTQEYLACVCTFSWELASYNDLNKVFINVIMAPVFLWSEINASHPSPPRILSFYNLTFPHLREQQQTTPLVKSAVQHAGEWGAGFHSYQNVQDFALSFLNMVV
jgi:hypothetical protein